MSKVLNSQYGDDLTYNVDYLVENQEYKPWRQRLMTQILSTVEVPGFRKGKAPEQLAMKQLNMLSVEETILQETISKFGTEALNEAKKKLTDEGRVVQDQTVDFDTQYTGSTDEGFKFRVVLSLIPKVDLSALEKIKKPKIESEDLPERVSKEDFIQRESNKFLSSLNTYVEADELTQILHRVEVDLVEEVKGTEPRDINGVTYTLGASELPPDFEANLIGLKTGEEKEFSLTVPTDKVDKKTTEVKYKATVKKVLKPEFADLDKLFEKSENAQKQFADKQKFIDFLSNYYDQETGVIEQDIEKRKIMQEALKLVPDFSLPIERSEAEKDRIMKVLQSQSESSGESLAQVFKESGIADSEAKGKIVNDPIEVKKLVGNYVDKEFKWIFILRSIYELKVEEKISQDQLETVAHEMEKKPEEYNISKGAEHQYYHEVAFDRLMRSKATTWLFDLVLNKKDKETTKSKAKNEEIEA
jgi:trigger factor